jgi:hypothetical protein
MIELGVFPEQQYAKSAMAETPSLGGEFYQATSNSVFHSLLVRAIRNH